MRRGDGGEGCVDGEGKAMLRRRRRRVAATIGVFARARALYAHSRRSRCKLAARRLYARSLARQTACSCVRVCVCVCARARVCAKQAAKRLYETMRPKSANLEQNFSGRVCKNRRA